MLLAPSPPPCDPAVLGPWLSLQVCIVLRGIDTIKDIETCSAPILVALAVALLVWAVSTAGGLGPMLAAPSQVWYT